jgi:hypothetical protein
MKTRRQPPRQHSRARALLLEIASVWGLTFFHLQTRDFFTL